MYAPNLHSSFIVAWTDFLRHASIWNSRERSAPMLAYIAVAPMLAQTGVNYINYIDHLLSQVPSGIDEVPALQLMSLAKKAAEAKDNEFLNQREISHLRALDCMLRHDHKRALMILLRHLQMCPGDGLALSLAFDLAHTVGDKDAAFKAAGSVAAYWNERRGKLLRPSIPGYSTATSLIALGYAVGGRLELAERLALEARHKSEKLAGGIATWALAHVFDAEGRTAEGISACANSEGVRHFESCGFLFFDSIIGGYGVRFALDREERGRGRSAALRLYDNNYERILDYSGFARGQPFDAPFRKAPIGWQKTNFEDSGGLPKTFISNVFGSSKTNINRKSSESEIVVKKVSLPSMKKTDNYTAQDVLTWLPPTPQLLSDATLLLLRLTLNGTISSQNYRWDNLRNAWKSLFESQRRNQQEQLTYQFYPMVNIAASLMTTSKRETGQLSGAGGRLAEAIGKMGVLLNLGGISTNEEEDEEDKEGEEELNMLSSIFVREIVADKDPDFWLPVQDDSKQEDWKVVLKLLSSTIDGVHELQEDCSLMDAQLLDKFDSWEFDVRPLLENALVFAACKCGDHESLSRARSICSQGVTLRPNSPEEWWRYSIVLGLLGDEVASEDALEASLSFGGGQGVRHD